MPVINPQVGAVNLTFRFLIKKSDGNAFDLTGYSATVVLVDPKKNRKVFGGIIDAIPTTGIITWTTSTVNDLDKSGLWRAQIILNKNNTDFPSQVASFKVDPNI